MQEAIKRMQPDWENISLANDFLFGKVMKDPKLCLEILRRALPEVDIERIDYVAGERPADPYIDQLDAAVKRAKQNRKWRREYMTLYMRDLENIEIGKEQGIEQGKREAQEQGIKILIETCRDLGEDKQATISRILLKYSFSREDAEKYVAKYWGM